MSVRRRGVLLVLMAPSGAGKSSLATALRAAEPGLGLSVSLTTRRMRPGEVEGVHYRFVDEAAFLAEVEAGRMLEHAQVFGRRYGTPRLPVEAALGSGQDMLFDIDWQGAGQVRAALPDDTVIVMILPPSRAELHRRLVARGQDDEAVIARRMAEAADEASHWVEADYVLVNTVFEESLASLRAILVAERLRRGRGSGLGELAASLGVGDATQA